MGLMHLNELPARNQPQHIGSHTCQQHKSDDLFAPIKSKMKVLKKIKKRMGLAPRNATSWPGPNNLPPLQFHDVHGDNIRLSRDRTMAKRYESFCKGVTFSARPVKINERVCVRFSEISSNWSGVIRFGFTYNDPATLRNNLPKYACPDLTNKPGYWAKALNERYCERDNILFYYVTAAGDVYFGINGEEKGVFITGIETRHPLWTLIDCYGNCSAIEFLDQRASTQQPQRHRSMTAEQEIERIIPAIQSMAVNEYPAQIVHRPTIAYGNAYTPVAFHRTKGRNIMLSADKLVASRADSEYCQGYVFTARSIAIGEKMIVQILRTDTMYVGALALGLTSCDPATLQASDLPGDSDLLLDRPEYWVVTKDVAANLNRGDEITFCVTANGEVQISKNNGPPSVVMHVDQSLQLWAFLDVYGSTQSVRVFSHVMASTPSYTQLAVPNNNNNANALVAQRQAERRRISMQMPSSESLNSASSQSLYRAEMQPQQRLPPLPCHVLPSPSPLPPQMPHPGSSASTSSGSTSSSACVINNEMIQLQPGGTVLVVNLPPATNNDINNIKPAGPRITQVPLTTAQTSQNSPMSVKPSPSQQFGPMASQWQDANNANHVTGAECTICYEHSIDSVLYTCGHMCMCYECAVKQWRGIGGGHCPLCRAVIRDVIRTYKS